MRVVVTGAAGMIGSNIVHGLNAMGIDDVIAVDDLTEGRKFQNLVGARLSDYLDKAEFYGRFARRELGSVDAVLHQGACSDTMEHDGRFMLENNYRASKDLLDACQAQGARLLYASSAAVYGGSDTFRVESASERPLNVYGYSKLLFDDIVRRVLPTTHTQIAGFRYFNVYGPREQHKARMASVAFHHFDQFRATGKVALFGEYGGFGPGEHARDFVFVGDVVRVNLWFLEHPDRSGIFNVGTGRSRPFNDVAHATINACRALQSLPSLTLEQQIGQDLLQYIPFPDVLRGKYQCQTRADLTALRAAGYELDFLDIPAGVSRYMDWLNGHFAPGG